MSIETGMPEVPRYAMYSGCALDQLSWQMQGSGLLTAAARLLAQGESVDTATFAGSPATLNLQHLVIQLLNPGNYMNNGGTAGAVAYDCAGVYVETDY